MLLDWPHINDNDKQTEAWFITAITLFSGIYTVVVTSDTTST